MKNEKREEAKGIHNTPTSGIARKVPTLHNRLITALKAVITALETALITALTAFITALITALTALLQKRFLQNRFGWK